MSELKFNDLPCEMLIKVFRFLDAKNLKNATLTCKLWNNLIESSCRWSLALLYDGRNNGSFWTKEPEQKVNFILTTDRKFGTIEIRRCQISDYDRILKIFQKHGFNVVELILLGCRFNNLVSIAELLNLTPNLKHADITSKILRGETDMPVDQVLPDLKKLKSLEMTKCDHKIIKCFKKAKLTRITIGRMKHSKSKDFDSFTDFLSSQEMLTSLNVCSGGPLTVLVELGKLNNPIPFRLTQLAISGAPFQWSSQDQDSVFRFLQSQAKHLQEMKIGFGIPSSIYECVFARMTELNKLTVSIAAIPRDNDFCERLVENDSVRLIRIVDVYTLSRVVLLEKFFNKLPNVRSLIFADIFDAHKNILVMAQNLTKVESLSIRAIGGRSIGSVKFPNLKTLYIGYLRGKTDWNEFTKMHPGLVELTIEHMESESLLTSDDIDHITTNVDLQNIRFGAGFKADERFFEIILEKCLNLKVLDLHNSCISPGLTPNIKINVLRLIDHPKNPIQYSYD